MSLLRRLVMLPLAPVEGVIWLAEQLEQQAAAEFYGPEAVRRQIHDLNAAYASGELTHEEFEAAEAELLDRLELGLSQEGEWVR